jgi:hypothetical protein
MALARVALHALNCALQPVCSASIVIGFASEGGFCSYESAATLSFYTQALVKAIDAHGHHKDVVQLLEDVRAVVALETAKFEIVQTPCVYSAKVDPVLLVSLVGSITLCDLYATTVGDAVRPLVKTLQLQVRNFSPCSSPYVQKRLELWGRYTACHVQVNERASELLYYIEPAAVEGDIPRSAASILEYVAQLDAASSVDVSQLLSGAARGFLSSGTQMLLLLGDAGSGKSTFMWQLVVDLLGACGGQLLDTPTSRCGQDVFPLLVPVYIELKLHKASDLGGLVEHALGSAGLAPSVVAALRSQDPLHPFVRLVVLADGFDELQGDLGSVADFVGTICGGTRWPAALLRFIVTSRENRLGDRGSEAAVFGEPGAYTRLLMLPFSRSRVRLAFTCPVAGCLMFRW